MTPLLVPGLLLAGFALAGLTTHQDADGIRFEMAQPDDLQLPASPGFLQLAQYARWQVMQNPDPAVAFAAREVPLYVQQMPTPAQVEAGGCHGCTYLGLWADKWPLYETADHGTIWMFEDGIRKYAAAHGLAVQDQLVETLEHEIGHALGRDHVLEAMKEAKARGQFTHPNLK